uniref:ribosomal protein S4 n=1 Tax=Klebsormidium mucosum TaxID=442831 RepID=UPI00286A3E55|nr:ribosomal protein S4 [Klebsormidium mucosum]WKT07152.1 ribosomal protein S4 [Klebsormidium mucosum]
MSRYCGPRLRIVRRLTSKKEDPDLPVPGLTSKKPRIRHLPGRTVELSTKIQSQKKEKPYQARLKEKQKLRYHYGVTERQLLTYVKLARKSKAGTGQALLQLLEMRLDNLVFRLGITPTIPAARQLVSHGHVLVNQHRVNIPSYRCKLEDRIAVRIDRASTRSFLESLAIQDIPRLPSHLTLESPRSAGSVRQLPERDAVGFAINELLVVEYYARKV